MPGDAWIGTSGVSHADGTTSPGALGQYARVLSTVEVNSSAQRPPSGEQLSAWADAVPPGFQFSLKVPRKLCQDLRLSGQAARNFGAFLEAAEELGGHLGPLLVQLPGSFTLDIKALTEFLRSVPAGPRLAFEFRHPSWHSPATLRILSAHDAALVITDTGEGAPRIELTAGFAYVRIQRDDDAPALWDHWAERLAALTRRGVDVYAFVKHDRRGIAVERARRLAALLRNEEQPSSQSLLT